MEYRQLGESELKASVITFGAWAIGGSMWGGANRKEAIEAIKASYDHGVTSIDTAPAYGQGLSEEIVGEAIRGIPRVCDGMLSKENSISAVRTIAGMISKCTGLLQRRA